MGLMRVGDRIEVFWPLDHVFYPGVLKRQIEDGKFEILYDDGDTETLDLDRERFRVLWKPVKHGKRTNVKPPKMLWKARIGKEKAKSKAKCGKQTPSPTTVRVKDSVEVKRLRPMKGDTKGSGAQGGGVVEEKENAKAVQNQQGMLESLVYRPPPGSKSEAGQFIRRRREAKKKLCKQNSVKGGLSIPELIDAAPLANEKPTPSPHTEQSMGQTTAASSDRTCIEGDVENGPDTKQMQGAHERQFGSVAEGFMMDMTKKAIRYFCDVDRAWKNGHAMHEVAPKQRVTGAFKKTKAAQKSAARNDGPVVKVPQNAEREVCGVSKSLSGSLQPGRQGDVGDARKGALR